MSAGVDSALSTLSVPRTVGEALYNLIKADILTGTIEGRLRFDTLRTRYGGGVGSLREALSRLESEGLIESEQHRFVRVPRLSLADFEDLVEIRTVIEARCLADSVTNGDKAWEERLRLAFTLFRDSVASGGHAVAGGRREHHDQVHESLVSACSSQRELWLRSLLRSQAERYLALAFSRPLSAADAKQTLSQHEALVEAALQRRTKVAVALMEDDLTSAARRVMPRLAEIEAERTGREASEVTSQL